VDFITTARPLWGVSIGLGFVITLLAVASTPARAERSAQKLAPLIEHEEVEPAHVG
jgi:hypothetical protein